MNRTHMKKDDIVDPVCLMEIGPGKKDLRYNYQSKTYYFCAEACKKSFELNPDKYIGQCVPKRKGIWGRYLDRLAKATGGKPMKCH